MEFFKLMTLTIMAITMVLTLLLTQTAALIDEKPIANNKRLLTSRFLQQSTKSPRSADHCNKDNEICNNVLVGKNATCCNNKCVDLGYDDTNCGGCKKKCDVTNTCCGGECVSLVVDKGHCGGCNHRCTHGGNCKFGMCDYA